jgi:hypothetical protein
MNMQHLYDGTVFYYRATDSTNKRAKLFAEGTPDGVTQGYSFSKGSDYLFAAGAQSSGRGRLG